MSVHSENHYRIEESANREGAGTKGIAACAQMTRFEKHMHRHKGIAWADVHARLETHPHALNSQYRDLQKLGEFDRKTSSWVKTPPAIRSLGGAIFCDRRYDTVFTHHDGADSYYAARGFCGSIRV